MKTKKFLSLSFVTIALALLSGCSTAIKKQVELKLEDQQVCFVAGIMAAGANCAHTISGETYELSLPELIKMLEPSKAENRPGAAIMSADHFNKIKTSLDIVCASIGEFCTLDIKEQLKKTGETISSVSEKSAKKAKK